LGIERRFFFPRHYWVLQTGVRASFVDLPVDGGFGDNQLVLSNFGFFGIYAAGGYRRLLGDKYDGSILLGATYQTTGDSYRAIQSATLEVRRQLTDSIHLGVKLDEVLTAYRLNADLVVSGQGHTLSIRPSVVIDWSL
jgi:hypothetical protein